MVKKRWIQILAASLMTTSLGVPTMWSYLRAAQHQAGQAIGGAVPLALELARLEQSSQALIPDINANRKVCAQLDVEVDFLKRDLGASQEQQVQAKSEMDKLREALTESKTTYSFGGKCFTRADVEADLIRRLETYQQQRDNIVAKERLLTARQQTLHAAVEKVRSYQRQYDKLLTRTNALRDELKLIDLAQAAGSVAFDDSKLTQAKKVADGIEKRVAVIRKLIDGEVADTGLIPVESDSRPASERFDAYFGAKPASPGSPPPETVVPVRSASVSTSAPTPTVNCRTRG